MSEGGYQVLDLWANSVVERGMTYKAAKLFVEQNEPPFNPRVGGRYHIQPEPISEWMPVYRTSPAP